MNDGELVGLLMERKGLLEEVSRGKKLVLAEVQRMEARAAKIFAAERGLIEGGKKKAVEIEKRIVEVEERIKLAAREGAEAPAVGSKEAYFSRDVGGWSVILKHWQKETFARADALDELLEDDRKIVRDRAAVVLEKYKTLTPQEKLLVKEI